MSRLLLSSGSVMGARLVGAGLGFITQIILARTLSADELGIFLFAASIATVAGAIAALGYPNVIPVLFARYEERAKPELAAAFARYTRGQVVRMAAMVAGGVVLISLAGFLSNAGLAIAAAALSIPANALLKVNGSLATGARRFELAFFPDLFARPLAFLIVVLAMMGFGLGISAVTLGLAGSLVAAAVTAYQWRSVNTSIGRNVVLPRIGRLIRSWRAAAWPLFIVSVFSGLFADLSVVLAGMVLSEEEMAAFGICIKLAFLVGFAVQLAHQIATPDLAASHARRNNGEPPAILRQANIGALALTFAALVVCISMGDRILALFGPHYRSAKDALIILTASQVLRACFGPNIQLMTITGLQRPMAVVFGFSIVVLAGANLMLIPLFGITGAAAAVALTTLFWTSTLAYLLYTKSGMRADVLMTT